MPTVDATIGGASSNSYVTTADGDTYFDERLGSTSWTGASADDKSRSVIMATRRLDVLSYDGAKTDTAQALQWPRYGTSNPDGYLYDSDVIPPEVKRATFELALSYLTDAAAGDPFAGSGLELFSEAQVGPLKVKIRGEGEGGKDESDLPEIVKDLLAHVLSGGGSGISVELVRG